MKYKIVTCFNETILNKNAAKLIQQFVDKWQPVKSIEFHCYYYDVDLSNYSLPESNNIFYHNLEELDDFNAFMERNKTHDGTEAGAIEYNVMLDATGQAPKIFALSECAFNNKDSWMVWLDPYCYTMKDIRLSSIKNILPPKEKTFSFLKLQDFDHFMAFDITNQSAVELLADVRGAFITDEFMNYREWNAALILNTLLSLYNAHGFSYKIITEETINYINELFVDTNNPTTKNLRDSDGNRVVALREDATTPDILPQRYKQLADLIRHYEPETILETGTWNAGRAIEMSLAAFDRKDKIHYIGFDLFEDATAETDSIEFNSKAHNTMAAVQKRLTEFADYVKKEQNKEFTFELYKGDVKDTLTSSHASKVDFGVIGSGNSINTVAHEYEILKNVPVVIADHYFTKDEADEIPPEKYQGVNEVFKSVATKKVEAENAPDEDGWTTFDEEATTRKHVLPSNDRVVGGGCTHLIIFIHDVNAADIPEDIKRVPIVVHPRDCVPKEYIQTNIQTNVKMIDEKKWVVKHPAHRELGIIVSAGPYLDYDKLKSFIRIEKERGRDPKVLAVKHAYPHLLKHGIKPWGCIVLDPRSIEGKSTHNIVRKDLFKDIDPDTIFFVASMTDPSVTKHLKDRDVNIWGWHAFTESLRREDERQQAIQNQTVKLNEDLGIPQGATLITGGTCAAMRGIGMMHTMGFRELHLFGFDCCRDEPTDEEKTETTGDIEGGETPKPKYIQVTVGDKTYWTTGELLAMAQDCEKIFADTSLDGVLQFHGEGTMVADLWDIKLQKEKRPQFRNYYA